MNSFIVTKMNKKGWIRIAEAFLSILIIAGAVLFASSKQVDSRDISELVYERQSEIFEVLANNEDYREEIVGFTLSDGCVVVSSGEDYKFITFIGKTLPNGLDFVVNICEIERFSAEGAPNDREVYVGETIISSIVNSYPNKKPRKLSLSVWKS